MNDIVLQSPSQPTRTYVDTELFLAHKYNCITLLYKNQVLNAVPDERFLTSVLNYYYLHHARRTTYL